MWGKRLVENVCVLCVGDEGWGTKYCDETAWRRTREVLLVDKNRYGTDVLPKCLQVSSASSRGMHWIGWGDETSTSRISGRF